MLADVARLTDAVPQVRVIIDHAANVRVDGKGTDDAWRNGLRVAAAHENVFCKVSGLVEGTGRTDGNAPRQVDYYRAVLDVLWDTFGQSRLVYGSNWPVSERFAPCSVVQSVVADYFASKGGAAAEKVFFKNSQQCYKWIARKAG
jgi:predicted TIM-barrel fold metal-dependent hydrolase